MIAEAALIMTCCVLFVQMGLADAAQMALHFKVKLLTCPKCLTFWTCLGWLVLHGTPPLISVAASFISSYCALWLALLYDALARLYNFLYEQVTKTDGTASDAQDAGPGQEPAAPADEVPQMQ